MPRSSHRARSLPGEQTLQTIGIVLVLVLVVAIAAVRFVGAEAVTAEPAGGSSDVVGATTALDSGPASPSASASDEASETPSSSAPDTGGADQEATATGNAALADPATVRKIARKLDVRRAELRDRAQEAADLARERRERALLRTAPFDVRVGTFNVLGSQHTAPGGERRNYPPASYRSPAQADFINAKALDIVGMQELQEDQLNTITARTGLTAWPGYAWGSKETDNSILYDAGRFELVDGEMWTIPFMGRPRPQPIIRLRVRDTGREFYVVNTHPSAGHYGKYAAERRYGQDVLIGVLSRLKATGLPILLTGDMNDREGFYDRVVCRGGMVSASGGSGCASRPPQMYAVDWVAGSPAVSFTDYVSDPGPGDRKLTDHYVVYATAHVG